MECRHSTLSPPEEAALIRERIDQIRVVWDQLNPMFKERDAKLEETGDLHRCLRDLDHFQYGFTKTQTDIASQEDPASLADAERLLSQHQNIKDEIENYVEDYEKMMEYGERIFAEPATTDDPQYIFLRVRLKTLKDGWDELRQMWDNRQELLSQSMNMQIMRNAKQAGVLLSQQEHILVKDETPSNLEQCENLIQRHEALLTTMDANDDKISGVIQFACTLCWDGHINSDKIGKKADIIQDRRDANKEKALEQMERLKDQIQLHQFLQDCEELGKWVQEKIMIAQDETYRSAKTVHSKWTRHQAFEVEIASNKDRFVAIQEAAERLVQQKPEFGQCSKPKVKELGQNFDDLERNTNKKGARLFDANCQVVYEQTCDDIDTWMNDLEKQIEGGDYGSDLASVNILMQKQQTIETQMTVKAKRITELESHAEYLRLMDPQNVEDFVTKKSVVENRFDKLKAPLELRKVHVEKMKEAYQFRRDVEDEKFWFGEKMPQAAYSEFGISLFNVLILKKNQSLRNEIEHLKPRIYTIVGNGGKLISEGHEAADEFEQLNAELLKNWEELKDTVKLREEKLLHSETAQQYIFDASEAVAWMSEQELNMMAEDRGKDKIYAHNLIKKHEALENAVNDSADTIWQLGETARQLILQEHPDSGNIGVKQAQVNKLYAGLKDLAHERRSKFKGALKLFMLKCEVDDLEQCIAQREVVARSHELGQDYDHVTMLWERFKEFAKDTECIGYERVALVNEMADGLIAAKHSDATTIAEWNDGLNEAWADLLELIDTRTQMLVASQGLHKSFYDCKDVPGRISIAQDFVVKMARRRKTVKLAFPNSKGGVTYPPKKGKKDEPSTNATPAGGPPETRKGPPAANTKYSAAAAKEIRDKQNNHNCPYCGMSFLLEGQLCIHIQQKCLELPKSSFIARNTKKTFPSKRVCKYNGGIYVAAIADFLCTLEPDEETFILPTDLLMIFNNNYRSPLRIRNGTPFSKDVPYPTYNDHLRVISAMQQRITSKTLKHVIIPVLFGTYYKPNGHILNEEYWHKREHASMILASLNDTSGLFEFSYYDSYEEDDMYLKAVKSDKLRLFLGEMFMQRAVTISNFHVFQNLTQNGCGTCVCHWAFTFVKTGVVADPQSPGTIEGLKRRLHDTRRRL